MGADPACADCEPGEAKTQPKNAEAEQRLEEDPAALDAIRALQRRDREVRAHELAHQTAGGQHAGSAQYVYATGPDGKRYAIGGSVAIDTGSEATPEQTMSKMSQVRKAALAPAQPSAADRSIAAKATSEYIKARGEAMAAQQQERVDEADEKDESDAAVDEIDAAKTDDGNLTDSERSSSTQPSMMAAIDFSA